MKVSKKYMESLLMDYNICNEQAIKLLIDEIRLTSSDSENVLFWWFKDKDKLGRVHKKYILFTVYPKTIFIINFVITVFRKKRKI
jgi:hypothetical protein